jgi:hypothetical protein
MSILSNKGRVIPSLDNYANPASGDLLIVQDMARNKTKNITFSQVSETLVGLLQGTTVNFTKDNNKFTGSFKGGFAKFDSYLTALSGRFSVTDPAFSATGFDTITLGSAATITLNSPTVVVGQILTVNGALNAVGGVVGNLTGNVAGNLTGNVTGDVKGDIYDNGGTQKILDNRTNNTALFRGSGSYASQSLSSSHALVADLTYTCLSHTTTADFATSARSASYASQSRSSSYLRYTGIPNGSSSYALKSGYALSAKTVVDIPDRALTASYLLWNATVGKNNGSASYARSASYAKSGSYARTASYLATVAGVGSPIAFSHASWTATVAGVVTPLTSYNISSITLTGTQPTTPDALVSRYADVVFSTPVGSANYTVLSYCSWNTVANIATAAHFADIGTSVVSARASTGFRVTTFVGWYAGTAGDGDDFWYNTSIFPDYSSFVVFK